METSLDKYRLEISRSLFDHMRNHGFEYKFARNVMRMLQSDKYREDMLAFFNDNVNTNLTTSDVLIRVIEITRKADLVEGHFYEINPDLKH